MRTDLEFFPIQPGHLEALSTLVNSAYRGDSSRAGWTTEADLLDGTRTDVDMLKTELETPGKSLFGVREVGNPSLLGCVSLQSFTFEGGDERGMYLGMLTVQPTLQGGGVGKFILQQAEEFARTEGVSRMTMGVVYVRDSLIAWYERHGYRRTGEHKPFPVLDPRMGIPKVEGLYFVMLEKVLRPA